MGFKGGSAGVRGRSTSRNPPRRPAEQPYIYGNREVEGVKRVPLFQSEIQATIKGEVIIAGEVMDTLTIVSGLSKNLDGNLSGSRSLENGMRSMNYDDVFSDCSAPITEMTGCCLSQSSRRWREPYQ